MVILFFFYLEYKKAKQDLKKVGLETVRLHKKVNKKGQYLTKSILLRKNLFFCEYYHLWNEMFQVIIKLK